MFLYRCSSTARSQFLVHGFSETTKLKWEKGWQTVQFIHSNVFQLLEGCSQAYNCLLSLSTFDQRLCNFKKFQNYLKTFFAWQVGQICIAFDMLSFFISFAFNINSTETETWIIVFPLVKAWPQKNTALQ